MQLDLAPPKCPRYQSLDLWRGVACLLVVFIHSALVMHPVSRLSLDDPFSWIVAATRRCWVGVPLFFVISGYCISATADQSRRKRQGVARYWWRRFRRIYPPYWICLVLSVIFVTVLGNLVSNLFTTGESRIPEYGPLDASQWIGNITLTESWRHWVVGSPQNYYLGTAWSLCYEEQFYIVVGLIVALMPRRFFLGAALISLAVLIYREYNVYYHLPVQSGFFFDERWLLFAAGILVYRYINYSSKPEKIAAILLLLILFGLSFREPRQLKSALPSVPAIETLVGFGFALLLIALHRFDGRISNYWGLEPLFWCGRRCYSIYLTHWPVVKAISIGFYLAGVTSAAMVVCVVMPTCLIAALVTGDIFYRYVESRFLNPPTIPRQTIADLK